MPWAVRTCRSNGMAVARVDIDCAITTMMPLYSVGVCARCCDRATIRNNFNITGKLVYRGYAEGGGDPQFWIRCRTLCLDVVASDGDSHVAGDVITLTFLIVSEDAKSPVALRSGTAVRDINVDVAIAICLTFISKNADSTQARGSQW